MVRTYNIGIGESTFLGESKPKKNSEKCVQVRKQWADGVRKLPKFTYNEYKIKKKTL